MKIDSLKPMCFVAFDVRLMREIVNRITLSVCHGGVSRDDELLSSHKHVYMCGIYGEKLLNDNL